MQVALHNKVKIYNLTAGKSLPEWLAEKKKNRAAAGEQRIELIHDLEFPHFTRCMFRTANGSYLFTAGDYPPRLKCYDVNQMSMKYSFNADMPIISGVPLSADFRKFALRGEGRVITVHHSAVIIDRLRVPHAQRGLTYHEHSAELLSPGSSAEIFRISLDTGMFNESFKTASSKGVNHVDYFSGSGLIFAACENGVVEAFDSRMEKPAGQLIVSANFASATTTNMLSDIDPGQSVTHLSTDNASGLLMCAGTSGGCVALYDIRSNKPLLVKDHMNSLPIVKTYFYQGGQLGGRTGAAQGQANGASASNQIITADTKGLKIWSKQDGANFTTLEAPATVYDFCVLKAEHNMAPPYVSGDSGVICVCCDTPRVQVHFIPQLGVAPKWCSFLDSITEELEEKEATVVYDDFKFISKEEYLALGLSSDEVANGKVRPYMHGFFVENRLYRELKAIADPGGFQRYANENAKNKKKAKRDDRISNFRRVEPGAEGDEGVEAEAPEAAVAAGKADPRFAGRLNKPGFEVDQKKAGDYTKLLDQVAKRREEAAKRHEVYETSQFRVVPQDENDDKSEEDDDDDEADLPAAARSKKPPANNTTGSKLQPKKSTGGGAGSMPSPAGGRQPTMYASLPGANVGASDKQIHMDRKRERERKLTLAERLERQAKKSRR